MRTYLPDFNHSLDNIRKLLKKDTPYIWDESMQKEFMKIKEILRSPMGLKPFNKNWKTILYTDYSSKGIGFNLTQENPANKKEKHLIYRDSASLNERQKKLPAIYGENLGIITALEKCR